MLCICTVACVLVKFLVPDGVTRKTLNFVITTVLIIAMIMPIKELFTESEKINIQVPSETQITEEYNEKVLEITKENLRKSVKSLLEQNNITYNNVYVSIKTDQNNGIIIDTISIYISNQSISKSNTIIDLIKENYSVTPQIILEQ